MSTPFSQIYGHDLSVNDINEIFIEDQKMTRDFIERHNSFIWGVRGSGKSMMLKYFDIEVQRIRYRGFKESIENNGFIGIYLLFRNGVFNMPNLEESNQHTPQMIHSSALYILSEHLILASILEALFEKLRATIDFESALDGDTEFYSEVSETLYCKDVKNTDITSYGEFFKAVSGHLKTVVQNTRNSLVNLAMGRDVDFSAIRFLDYVVFCDVIRSVQNWIYMRCGERPSFYFLLDDVNFLFSYQQKILNTWIGQRRTDIICFKLASEPFGYESFMTLSDNRELQNIADFQDFYLDFDVIFDKHDKQRKKKIYEDIADRRIAYFKKQNRHAVLPDSIVAFLPTDQQQDKYIENLRHELSKKYADKERERSRQVMPELHRRYGRVYCGFDDVVTISFGNIRDFLRLCDQLYYAYQEKNMLGVLPAANQNKTIKRFSHDLLDFKNHLSFSANKTDNQLYTFMLNLLSLIKYRLNDETQMERTFDAFIIKNISSLEADAKAVLRRGIVLRLFRKSYYTGRKHLRQDVFIINKRLFPEYELNISEVGGRFEFTPEQFTKALLDEKYFIKELSNSTDEGQLNLFEIQDDRELDEEEKYAYDYGRLF